MVDIQPTATAPTAATPMVAASSELTAVPVTVTALSQALDNLTRVIQTNATPTALQDNTLTLITALGSVTVTLAQQASTVEQQNMLQQLMTLIQAQRPLTLALQPGAPPTQGTLLIPAPPVSATTAPPSPTAPPVPLLPLPPLTTGESMTAIVLPPVTIPNAPATNLPPALPTALPPTANAATTAAQVLPETAQSPQPPLATVAPQSQTPPTPTNPPPSAAPVPEVRLTAISVPQTLPTPTSPEIPPQAGQSAPPLTTSLPTATPLPQQAPQPQLQALLHPGNEVLLHVDAFLPSATAAIAAKQTMPPLAPNQIIATVSGFGSDGQLILKAGDTTLFVKAQVSAPLGTKLVLTVETVKPEPLLPLPVRETSNFSALPQAVAALAQLDPQLLQQVMSTRLPQATAALPGALLFLFSAFKQGNVGSWLGNEATNRLFRAGKEDILRSLAQELSGAGQPVQDAVVGEWKAYPLPLYAQQQFQALTLYVHNDRDGQNDQRGGKAADKGKIRFLIDMNLSKLGSMQIDGFVQPKKIDMILRSETTLPTGLPNDLRSAYIKAIEAVGYAGSLHFQVGRKHWMMMQQPASPSIRA